MSKVSGGIAAKARCIYGKRLKKEDYMELLQRQSVSAAVGFLKGTKQYGGCLTAVNEQQVHRGQLEEMISKNVFSTYMRLCRFAASDKNSFYNFYVKKLEVRQLLVAIMYIDAKSYDGYATALPAYFIDYSCYDLNALARANSYSEILEVVEKTPYHAVLKAVLPAEKDGALDFEKCSIALYTVYFKWAIKAAGRDASGKKKEELCEAILRQLDMDNILLAYRMKNYFKKDNGEILKMLVPFHNKISPNLIREALSSTKSDNELVLLLERKFLRDKVPYDADNLEVAVKQVNYNYYKSKLKMSQNGLLVFYSLISLLQIECDNVTAVIEGIRYNFPSTEILKLLIGVS